MANPFVTQVDVISFGGGAPPGVSLAALQLPDNHNVQVSASALPTGAATAANQLPDNHQVTVSNASLAVTAASLPLPTGAATSANQLPDNHQVSVSNFPSESDTTRLDSFGRQRVSEPVTQIHLNPTYDLQPEWMEVGSTGTASTPTFSTTTGAVTLTTAAGTGTSFVQSNQYGHYNPGKSHFIAMTFAFGTGVAGNRCDVGYFDDVQGVFLRQNGTGGLQFVSRTSISGAPVETTVDKTSWSIDSLDGLGPSGVTIDEVDAQIVWYDLQYLGVGRVRCGFDIGGVLILCHEFLNANSLAGPYWASANLPLQWLMSSSGAAGKTMISKCGTVFSEGGLNELAEQYTSQRVTSIATLTTTQTSAWVIRPRLTYGGITNRCSLQLTGVDIVNTGNAPISWKLVLDATYSVAPTFSNVDATYSAFESAAATGTYTASSGTIIGAGVVASTNAGSVAATNLFNGRHPPITLDRAGAVRGLGTLSLIMNGIGASTSVSFVCNWRELH